MKREIAIALFSYVFLFVWGCLGVVFIGYLLTGAHILIACAILWCTVGVSFALFMEKEFTKW
jgi:CHASE2 domain-containing sensor protein